MTQHASYMAGIEYSPADMLQREDDWVNPGVLTSSDLIVTAGSNLTVNVSGAAQGSDGGNAWLPGGYRFYNDAVKSITLATANATNPRIDLIVAGIDTSVSPYVAEIIAITGTPAASPIVPTPPGTLIYIALAQIAVAANTTTIVAGNITDVRTMAGIIPLTSHLADNSKQIPHLGTTTNVGDAYSITTTETINANQKFTIRFNATSTTAPTLNINSGTAYPIKKPNGNNAKLYLVPYTLFWDGLAFTLLGEGGEYGTVTANDVRNTKTVGTENGVVPGTLDLSLLTIDNIREGITIDGKTGTCEPLPTPTVVGDSMIASSDTEVSGYCTSTTKVLMKQVTINKAGSYRIMWSHKNGTGTYVNKLQLFINEVAYGTIYAPSTTYVSVSVDLLNVVAGSVIKLYTWNDDSAARYSYAKEFRVGVASPYTGYVTVNQ